MNRRDRFIAPAQPRALVLRAPGINCDRETAHACLLAGFFTDLLHINHLIKQPQRLLDYHLLVIPGGFSYGDDLGAGTLLATNLTTHLREPLAQFIDEERLILGICNGFQVLVRAGLLPGEVGDTPYRATLADNATSRFECRWVTLAALTGRCVFTSNISRPFMLPVAHGEGRFVSQGDITHLLAYHQVPLLYALPENRTPTRIVPSGEEYTGQPLSGDTLPYPYNPNGSLENVAGLSNATGTIFGLMPHPERYVSALQHPQHLGAPDGTGDGLLIFKNAYEYVSRHVGAQFIAPLGVEGRGHTFTSDDIAPTPPMGRDKSGPYGAMSQSSYAASGVDIEAADQAKELMKEAVRAAQGSQVLAGMGAFAGVIDGASIQQMRRPALVASTDGVGTKTLIAAQARRYDTIGFDLVNHSVNDLLAQGARPLFFMDYLAMDRLDAEQAAAIVSSVAGACRAVGCALLGGETAEMPDVYLPGAFDLAGTIVGFVEQESLITGRTICSGDAILGLPSSGLHTNGYSLARKVFARYQFDTVFTEVGEPLVDALLRPHRCYLREVQALQEAGITIKGIAHITGGGFAGNISRILPEGARAVIGANRWNAPPIFALIARLGKISNMEMYRTFNMGVGMALVFAPEDAARAQTIVPELFSIGFIDEGNGVTIV